MIRLTHFFIAGGIFFKKKCPISRSHIQIKYQIIEYIFFKRQTLSSEVIASQESPKKVLFCSHLETSYFFLQINPRLTKRFL